MFGLEALSWASILAFLMPFLKTLIILLLGHFLIKYAVKLTTRAFSKSKFDPSLVKYCINALRIVAYIFIILSALDGVGVSTSSIVAALSASALAIGIALKDSLSNVAGGIWLLFSPRFATGDYIAAGGDEGTVLSVELLHTTLQTVDAKVISIPNGALVNSHIINYTRENKRRVDITFPIAYEADVKVAKQVAYDTIVSHPMVLTEPDKPFVRVHSYGDSAVNLATRTWCKSADYWTVYFDLIENVREAFDQNNIAIPYHQLDVHIKQN